MKWKRWRDRFPRIAEKKLEPGIPRIKWRLTQIERKLAEDPQESTLIEEHLFLQERLRLLENEGYYDY